MSQVLAESDFEYIEHLSDGGWLIRYGVVPVGYSPSGERLLTFGSSEFLTRLTVEHIQTCIKNGWAEKEGIDYHKLIHGEEE